MKHIRLRRTTGLAIAAALLAAAPFLTAQAQQQHAHVHGQLKLDVAVDGPTVVIDMESPLDNIVGFERAPKTDAEKKIVEDAVAQLRAADKLFIVDPAANCKLGPVDLRSGALGLGNPDPNEPVGHAEVTLDDPRLAVLPRDDQYAGRSHDRLRTRR